MRKFSVAFRKLFREISHFYRENKAKFREDIFAKCEHFVKTMSLTAATNNCRKELVEFCSDSSWFEVLLCHMNNFSSFTLINVWWREFDFNSYRFKFFYVSHFFQEIFAIFSQDFSREIFALFSLKIFRIFAKQFKAKYSENKYFRERTIWENEAK